LVVLPIAADPELDRVLAVALAPDVLDEAPLPIGLPITLTLGLATEDDCEADELIAVDRLSEPAAEVCA
jgi:hypothetical protein